MPFNVKFDPKKGCILVSVQGKLDLPLLQEMATEVSKVIEKEGCKCIINDLREAKIVDKAFDVYQMPKAASEAGIVQGCRRALIVGDREKDFHFLETVFINRGHLVKTFAEMDEAEQWLLEKRTLG